MMRSLRAKVILALVASSVVTAVSVRLISRWMVMHRFGKESMDRSFKRFAADMTAYWRVYGSWEEGHAVRANAY